MVHVQVQRQIFELHKLTLYKFTTDDVPITLIYFTFIIYITFQVFNSLGTLCIDDFDLELLPKKKKKKGFWLSLNEKHQEVAHIVDPTVFG